MDDAPWRRRRRRHLDPWRPGRHADRRERFHVCHRWMGSVYKIDTHGGKGTLLWKMDSKTDHDWAGAVACCGVDNRGVALWGDLVISHTLDGRLIATNKETGPVAWRRNVADPAKGEGRTRGPTVVQ